MPVIAQSGIGQPVQHQFSGLISGRDEFVVQYKHPAIQPVSEGTEAPLPVAHNLFVAGRRDTAKLAIDFVTL